MQRFVEEQIVPLVDGVDSYEKALQDFDNGRLHQMLDDRWPNYDPPSR